MNITENDLLELMRIEEARFRKRQEALGTVLEMVSEQALRDSSQAFASGPAHLSLVQDENPRMSKKRVRGILAAVRRIIPELPDIFDRRDVLKRLREIDPEFGA